MFNVPGRFLIQDVALFFIFWQTLEGDHVHEKFSLYSISREVDEYLP